MIYENSFDISIALDSSNREMVDLFDYIKTAINKAPKKYDFVIKNKRKICFSYILELGNIIGIILSTILICLPPVFSMMISGCWILYPLFCLILGYLIGTIIFSNTMDNLYKNIDMEKIYDGYNPNTFESKYKPDKQSYINSSEVIIGKNINNISDRKKIKKLYLDKKKYIKFELLVIAFITLLLAVIQIIR